MLSSPQEQVTQMRVREELVSGSLRTGISWFCNCNHRSQTAIRWDVGCLCAWLEALCGSGLNAQQCDRPLFTLALHICVMFDQRGTETNSMSNVVVQWINFGILQDSSVLFVFVIPECRSTAPDSLQHLKATFFLVLKMPNKNKCMHAGHNRRKAHFRVQLAGTESGPLW